MRESIRMRVLVSIQQNENHSNPRKSVLVKLLRWRPDRTNLEYFDPNPSRFRGRGKGHVQLV